MKNLFKFIPRKWKWGKKKSLAQVTEGSKKKKKYLEPNWKVGDLAEGLTVNQGYYS